MFVHSLSLLILNYFFVTCFRSIARLLILSSKKNLLLAKDANGLTPVQHAIQGGTDRYRFPSLLFIASPPLLSQIQRVCIADVIMDETAAGH